MLYWFRTPPGVKVGRAALDDDAIRRIEQLNPGITFEWPRIGNRPAPGRPTQPRASDRFVSARTLSTPCACWVMPMAQARIPRRAARDLFDAHRIIAMPSLD